MTIWGENGDGAGECDRVDTKDLLSYTNPSLLFGFRTPERLSCWGCALFDVAEHHGPYRRQAPLKMRGEHHQEDRR